MPSISYSSTMRPEAELLLRYTGPVVDAAATARIAVLLGEGLDMEYLHAFALKHRLSSLLYARINQHTPGALPPEFMARLQPNAEAISRNNLLLTGELMRLLRLFAAAGVEVLPFKGPLLATRLYGNLAVRPFGDLDLLVRPSQVASASAVMRSAGYEPDPPLAPREERAYLRYENDRTFVNRPAAAHAELHWHFFSRYISFPLDAGEFWERLEHTRFGGLETPTLPPEEMLLFLAAHGAKHHWFALGWILDIAMLVHVCGDIDWDRAIALARRLGGLRLLHLALALAGDIWGIALPEAIREQVARDREARRLAARVHEAMFVRDAGSVEGIEEHRFYLASRERLRDKIHYLWFWLFTPNLRDQRFVRLPGALAPLHYLLRPVRMVMDGVKGKFEG